MKRHTLNHAYFSVPDIENSYWAGFIAADGNISDADVLQINLKTSDIQLLEKLKLDILFSGNIRTSIRHTQTPNGNKYNTNVSTIAFTSKQICSDLLNNYNITSRKSLTLCPPNLSGMLALSFISGYIDGDGYIGIIQDKTSKYFYERLQFEIAGTLGVCNWIKSFTDKILEKETKPPRPEGKFYKYSLFNSNAYFVCKHLENNYKSGLRRKWDKYLEYYERHSDNILNGTHNPNTVKKST